MRSAALQMTLFGLGLLAQSCQEEAGDETIRTDSAGVEIVRYTGDDRTLDWPIDTVRVLGGGTTEPGDSIFYDVTVVRTDAAGNIYVLDRDAYRVMVYDSSGTFSKSLGAQGGGPGEFEGAISMDVTADGTVGVLDFTKRAVVRFDSSGAPIDPIRMEGFFPGGPIHQDGPDLILPGRNVNESRTLMTHALVRTNSTDTTELVSFQREMGDPVMIESCGIRFSGQGAIFNPSLRWAARASRIAAVTDSEYDVLLLHDDTPTLVIRRDVPPIPASAERALQSLGDGISVTTPSGRRECDSDEIVEKRGYAEQVPAIDELAIAPDGGVWISRNGAEHERNFTDIFDASGAYLGTLPASYPFPEAFVSSRTIVTRDENALGVARILVIRLESGGPT